MKQCLQRSSHNQSTHFFKLRLLFSHTLDHPIHPPKVDNDPWECEFLDDCGYSIKILEGVYQIYEDKDHMDRNIPIDYQFPRLDEFVRDMHLMCALIADGPLKSFCYRRLSYLSSKFQLHVLLNELRELAAQKAVAHRDFYNARKVSENSIPKLAVIF